MALLASVGNVLFVPADWTVYYTLSIKGMLVVLVTGVVRIDSALGALLVGLTETQFASWLTVFTESSG